MVSFGNASGQVPPFDIGILSAEGVALPDPADARDLHGHAGRPGGDGPGGVRGRSGTGKVKVEIRHTYPLAEAAQVHRDLEGRKTVGSIVMVP